MISYACRNGKLPLPNISSCVEWNRVIFDRSALVRPRSVAIALELAENGGVVTAVLGRLLDHLLQKLHHLGDRPVLSLNGRRRDREDRSASRSILWATLILRKQSE